eukprot:TRINITY_DN2103_c0_g1_i2.p1 TRINITY_DN2103_c0_g1~~TRINITY_DN2103_c0_g1_i2.p1  ORF type:complete len:787 (+),score=206.86 TRINITY_DN2103_c0_g1_i2:174-2534(+)
MGDELKQHQLWGTGTSTGTGTGASAWTPMDSRWKNTDPNQAQGQGSYAGYGDRWDAAPGGGTASSGYTQPTTQQQPQQRPQYPSAQGQGVRAGAQWGYEQAGAGHTSQYSQQQQPQQQQTTHSNLPSSTWSYQGSTNVQQQQQQQQQQQPSYQQPAPGYPSSAYSAQPNPQQYDTTMQASYGSQGGHRYGETPVSKDDYAAARYRQPIASSSSATIIPASHQSQGRVYNRSNPANPPNTAPMTDYQRNIKSDGMRQPPMSSMPSQVTGAPGSQGGKGQFRRPDSAQGYRSDITPAPASQHQHSHSHSHNHSQAAASHYTGDSAQPPPSQYANPQGQFFRQNQSGQVQPANRQTKRYEGGEVQQQQRLPQQTQQPVAQKFHSAKPPQQQGAQGGEVRNGMYDRWTEDKNAKEGKWEEKKGWQQHGGGPNTGYEDRKWGKGSKGQKGGYDKGGFKGHSQYGKGFKGQGFDSGKGYGKKGFGKGKGDSKGGKKGAVQWQPQPFGGRGGAKGGTWIGAPGGGGGKGRKGDYVRGGKGSHGNDPVRIRVSAPMSWSWRDVKHMLSEFGEASEVHINTEGGSRFGYATMTSVDAMAAQKSLTGTLPKGYSTRIIISIDPNKRQDKKKDAKGKKKDRKANRADTDPGPHTQTVVNILSSKEGSQGLLPGKLDQYYRRIHGGRHLDPWKLGGMNILRSVIRGIPGVKIWEICSGGSILVSLEGSSLPYPQAIYYSEEQVSRDPVLELYDAEEPDDDMNAYPFSLTAPVMDQQPDIEPLEPGASLHPYPLSLYNN